jgi:acid phosphatase type 7
MIPKRPPKVLSQVLFFCLLFIQVSVWAETEPFGLYLTWQQNPESSMSIQWISDKGQKEDAIEFQKEGEDCWRKACGKHMFMPSELPYIIHFVELKDLKSASGYSFRIGKEGKIYKFRTMPSNLNQPIRFIVGGDMYNGTLEMMEKTNKAAAAADPFFVVIGGDIAYSASGIKSKAEDSKRWLDWVKTWKNTMVTPEGYLIPIIPAIGNHEVRGGSNGTPNEAEFFYALFPMPGIEGYNVLDFSDYMSIVLLDSGHTNPVQGPQTEWLKQALSQRWQMPHKFAVYHVPAYPSYRNYNAPVSRAIRKNWVPLFEQYGLNAAFENNDHAYKRTHLILNGRRQARGVLYIGDGAWSVANVRKPKTPKQAWYIAKSAETQYFLIVTLEGLHRHFEARTPDGVLIDEVCQ